MMRIGPFQGLRRPLCFILLAVVAILTTASCDRRNDQSRGILIKPSEIDFPGMQLRPGAAKNDRILVGRIRNRSKQYTITSVELRLTMEDVVDSGPTTTAAAIPVLLAYTVPPGESSYFEQRVSFGTLPQPRGRYEWNYAAVRITAR